MRSKTVFKTASLLLAAAISLSFSGCFKMEVEFPSINSLQTEQQSVSYAETQTLPNEALSTATETNFNESTTVTNALEPNLTQPQTNITQETTLPASTSPDTLSGEALLSYFNNAVNTVKTSKAGFSKSKLTSVADLQLSNSAANALVGIVKSSLLSETEDVTPVQKGQNSNTVMSPSGKSYVSMLTMNDVTSVKCQKNNDLYVITVNVKGETNPSTSNSACSKVFDFLTVDDVLSTYAPKVGATVERKDIEVVFSDCYAKLTVNAAGVLTGYETYVKANMILHNAEIKKVVTIKSDVNVTLVSTTKYNGFSF